MFTSGNRDDVNILFTFIQSEAFPAPNLTMTQKHQNKEFLSCKLFLGITILHVNTQEKRYFRMISFRSF